jgi:hypothetical protein
MLLPEPDLLAVVWNCVKWKPREALLLPARAASEIELPA